MKQDASFADARTPDRHDGAAALHRHADDDLVTLAGRGDSAAFAVIYRRHRDAVHAVCRRLLESHEETEDAVQQTFLAAHRDLLARQRTVALGPWLRTIAHNQCISLLRTRRPLALLDEDTLTSAGPTEIVQLREETRQLLADLTRLPGDQRAALLLAGIGELDHAEIATELGCHRQKVKALVFQARAGLAAMREARSIPCAQIRHQLATGSGTDLRRGPLRRHLAECDGCHRYQRRVAPG